MADKGYKSKANDQMLKKKKSKSRVMHKAYRNKPLTNWQIKYNKAISKTRWVVERTFGSLKRWFGLRQDTPKRISQGSFHSRNRSHRSQPKAISGIGLSSYQKHIKNKGKRGKNSLANKI